MIAENPIICFPASEIQSNADEKMKSIGELRIVTRIIFSEVIFF